MPPRIPLIQAARCCRAQLVSRSNHPSLASLFAVLSLQSRNAHILASLSDNPAAYGKRIRRGRGPSSGYGKTSGRGHKGQKQHGKVKPWFQGGQTPLWISHGLKGFENHRAPQMKSINLDRLQEWIDAGRLDATKPITPVELYRCGLLGNDIEDGVKLLARGGATFRTPIDILVSRASAAAIEAIERAGGKIVTRFYTRDALRRLLAGKAHNTATPLPTGPEHVASVMEEMTGSGQHVYRLPDPTSREDIEYYRDPAHRGYLSHQLKPGESPSLYFKVPNEKRTVRIRKKVEGEKKAEETLLF